MKTPFKRVLIIADIEGSSGCWNYRASSFMTDEWAIACLDMTRDVRTVVEGLFEAGVEQIRIKDFHRTGFNLLPELIDRKSEIIQGYRHGPVPGIGDPGQAEAIIFLGMHAASGTEGFLAHTLTSRIERLDVNGNPLAEVALFSSSLAPYGLRPLFFSGCPVACGQAAAVIRNISVFPIDKTVGRQQFNAESWRFDLKRAVVAALENDLTAPYQPPGPFQAAAKMRGREMVARKIAKRWKFGHHGDWILIKTSSMQDLYINLIRACYLTPLREKTLWFCLFGYNLWGRIGLGWVRRRLKQLQLV
jgi:D-amino peptidase